MKAQWYQVQVNPSSKTPITQEEMLTSVVVVTMFDLPPLLSCEPLVQESEDFWYVELNILKIKIVLVVLLHLEQVVEFEIEFEQSAISAYSSM